MFLTLLVFIPLVVALLLLFVPQQSKQAIRTMALIGTGIPLVMAIAAIPMYLNGTADNAGLKLVEKLAWFPSLGINYYLGLDGFGLAMILLSTFLFLLAVIAGFGYITERTKEYHVLLLLLAVGTNGVFVANNFMLFYVFWELVLLPMYFLIGIWGGPRRQYAAIKFFIYTLVGSVLMLVGAIYLYNLAGATASFDLPALAAVTSKLAITGGLRFAFLAILLGFAVKVPMFPFHTWLPDAHVEAPTPISMLLAGILLKLGTFAMLRILWPLLPQVAQVYAPMLAVLGIVGIIYGAAAALVQKDFKKMVAYSSVSHMGYFVMGLAAGTSMAISGAFFVTVSHGLISALFFFIVGMYYERTHTRELDKLGGMWLTVPVITTVMVFTAMANLGLPGLSGFIGEWWALAGSYQSSTIGLSVAYTTLGLVLTGAFNLVAVRKVAMGEAQPEWAGLKDITWKERIVFAPLAALIIIFGVWPAPLLNLINPAVTAVSHMLGGM